MTQPRIDILGVYRLEITDELLRGQMDILYGSQPNRPAEAERQCREQLESVVLVEALVSNRDERFDVGDFTQSNPNMPRENWQAPWAEAYLAPDGESLLVERWSVAPADDPLRMAFFIHYWNTDRPLQTSYGDVQCSRPQPMPERLKRLVPYEPVD